MSGSGNACPAVLVDANLDRFCFDGLCATSRLSFRPPHDTKVGTPLENLTRDALEAEVIRLREALNEAEGAARTPAANVRQLDGASNPVRVTQDMAVIPGLMRPVSEQTALIDDDARQHALFAAIDVAMVLTDLSGVITDWSFGAEQVMGWTAAEMLGEHISAIFTAVDRDHQWTEAILHRAMREGRTTDECWYLRRDGQQFWGSSQTSVLRHKGATLGYLVVLREQTDADTAGRAVQQSHQRYRLAANATNDAVWDWDLTNNQVLWNDALHQAYGHALAEVENTGSWWIEHIHPDDRARIDASIHAIIEGTGITWSDEYRFLRADGSYADVLDRGQVIRNGEGRAERMIGAMLDLTRMRDAEAALRQSEERFRTILETVDAAFAIVQVKFDEDDRPVDYRFIDANPAFERQTGVDLRGKWVTEYAPDLERFWFETYGHVAKTGEAANFENYAEAFGRWFDVRAVRVGDPAGRQIAILFNDVTQRREAEERLRVSEALARENVDRVQLALAAGAIIGTWNWDLPADRFTVDEGFAYAFGLDPAMGRDRLSLEQIVETVHPEDRPGLMSAISEVISRGGAYAHQYRVRRTDGKYYWIEANGRVDRSEDGTPLSFPGVLIDVEDRRSIEAERDRATAALRALNETLEQRVAERTAELIQAEEKLRQSQKMEAVGQLTGGLAHDFNNLLAGISGALELINMRISQRRLDDIDKYMAAAQGAAKRAAALTHRLLAFSRRQTLDPRPIDVNMLVEGMTELIQRTVGPSIRL